MSTGEAWTSNNNITATSLNTPIFESYFENKKINGYIYNQKLSLNNKIYYLCNKSPNQGTYYRDNNETGIFNYIRGVLVITKSDGTEVEKLTNNHNLEIDKYVIDY